MEGDAKENTKEDEAKTFEQTTKIANKQTLPTKRSDLYSRNLTINMNVGAAAFILNKLSRSVRKVGNKGSTPEEIRKKGLTTEAVEEYETAAKKKYVRAIIIHVVLIVALIAYSFIGAFIFQALEERAAEQVVVDLITAKSKLIDQIWAANSNETDKADWSIRVDRLLTEYDTKIAEAANHGIDIHNKTQHRQNITVHGNQWNIWNSLFYAGTIYTTIGYGHLTPITTGGRIATMIYAVFGIPLCLIVLADMGGLFGEILKYIMRLCKRCFYKCRFKAGQRCNKSPEEIEHLSGVSVFACLGAIWIIYMFTGAAIYRLWETQWSYEESFYFLFISFSTIGLGDIVPDHPKYFLISFIYIFFGLALLSTAFTVMQQVLQSTVNKASDQLDAKLGFDTNSGSSMENVRDEVGLVQMSNVAEKDDNSVHD